MRFALSRRTARRAPGAGEEQRHLQGDQDPMHNATALEGDARAVSLPTRDQLLNQHLGLVHHIARQLSRSLAADVDLDELVSSGTIGLINALDGFDPSRGLAFSTFAAPRIRGAILDDLRRQDHASRSIRRKSRDLATARGALMRELGQAPSSRELAARLEIDLETLGRWQADVEGIHHVALDRPMGDGAEGTTPLDVLSGSTGQEIENEINLQQELAVLREALTRLNEQERVVLSLYFFEELKLHEIATVLQVTESRISQIRSKALAKLRTEMAPLREQVA
jgi:RNA polymerase sigma factor for flagellar operon FliA